MSSSTSASIPRTLTIADSYSDGDGGIQIDLKTFTALSTRGVSVVTALVTGKPDDVKAIHTVPEDFVTSQFHAVTSGISVDALKIGIHFSSSLIECVVSLLTETQIPNVVVDPVMVSTQLSPNSLSILRDRLLPVATLVILTLKEAAILLDRDILSLDDVKRAAQDLHCLGPKYVLIKGDCLTSDASLQTSSDDENTVNVDVLFDGSYFTLFKSSHVSSMNAHNTRCTLSAAITAYLAFGFDMIHAVQNAIAYTRSVVQNSVVLDRNKPQQQQNSQLESGDRVVIVSSQFWIHEARVLPEKRSFVQLMKNACLQEWFDYTHHPFVQGLANGNLPQTSFKHYLTQDYIFLTHFARCNALAAYKSNSMTEISFAAEIVCHISRVSNLHITYCAEWGIDATSLASTEEAHANLAYTRFTLDCGMAGDLLDLRVALSPCLFGYGEIGLRLFNDPATKRDSPYWKWISTYAADDYQQACREGEQLLERLADEYGVWHAPYRMKKLTATFKTATKLEIGFWDMGLNVKW